MTSKYRGIEFTRAEATEEEGKRPRELASTPPRGSTAEKSRVDRATFGGEVKSLSLQGKVQKEEMRL